MAKQIFRTSGVNLNDLVWHIAGTGLPGSSTETDNAPLGSLYNRADGSGGVYKKIMAGAGTDKWSELVDQAYVDAHASARTWRDPVVVMDNTAYADMTAAEAALNTGTMDGVTLTEGDRVLLPSVVTPGSQNVHIVTGTPGAGATFVEDTNQESNGDALFIQGGTHAGQQIAYNGTAWVLINEGASTEIGFIQAYIGKGSDGSTLPNYTSENYVTDGDSLEVAVGKLDNQAKTNVDAIIALVGVDTAIQTEIDAIETSLGTSVNADGTWNGFTGTNYLDGSSSNTAALTDLDSQTKTNADAIAALSGSGALKSTAVKFATLGDGLPSYTNGATVDGNVVATGDLILALDGANAGAVMEVQAAGAPIVSVVAHTGTKFFTVGRSTADGKSGSYVAYQDGGLVIARISESDADDLDYYGETNHKSVRAKLDEIGVLSTLTTTDKTSVVAAVNEIKAALGSSLVSNTVTGITTATEVDSVLVDEVISAKWILSIFDEATPTQRVSTEVLAIHDGTPTSDATTADFTEYARLKLGAKINGLDIFAQVSGAGPTQKMQLMVTSTGAVTAKITRLKVE